MVKYSDEALDRTFAALADPTRRALLARLEPKAGDGMPVSALAEPFAMSLPAILKHLKVLSDAGLVTRTKSGRTVTCRLNAEPMAHAMEWLDRYERFWTERLDRLAALVDEDALLEGGTPLEDDTCPRTQTSRRSQVSPSSGVSKPHPKRSTPPGPTPKKS